MQNFFQKNNKVRGELFQEIEAACDGLIYISEADAPVVAFAGEKTEAVTIEAILKHTRIDDNEPFEERDFYTLFDRLTTHKDWHREDDTARVKKYLALKILLEENLHGLTVFRFGMRRLDIFVVGIDKDGYLMGVTTTAVET